MHARMDYLTAIAPKDAGSPILDLETSLFTTDQLRPISSSQSHGWDKLYAVHTHEYPHRCLHHSVPFFWLSMNLRDVEVQRSISGNTEFAFLPANSITLAEPLASVECFVGSETEAFHVFIRPELMQEVANETFEADLNELSLKPVFGQVDGSLSLLTQVVKQMLREKYGDSRLRVDYISRAICTDLFIKYSQIRISSPDDFGLTPKQRRLVDEYIRENIDKEISSEVLASLCSMGKTTLFRRFRASHHMPPHQYVLRMRVDKAKQMLNDTTYSLAEIGLACGFSNQAHFATIFKRFTRVTPTRFKRECS